MSATGIPQSLGSESLPLRGIWAAEPNTDSTVRYELLSDSAVKQGCGPCDQIG